MSSHKLQTTRTCYHCGLKTSHILKCSNCKLWDFKAPYIPKNDYLYAIKDIYVINLKKDSHRIKSFFNKLSIQNISLGNRQWKKFTGVDGSNMTEVIDNINDLYTDMKDKTRIYNHWEKYPGSVGCYLSHLKLWEHILTGNNEYTLIMEDDSFFTPYGLINTEILLRSAMNMEWDMLYVGHFLLKGSKVHPLFAKPISVGNMKGYNTGLFGYIIRKSSIPKLLAITKTFETPFIDVHIRNKFGNTSNDIQALFSISDLIRHDHSGKSTRHTIDKTS